MLTHALHFLKEGLDKNETAVLVCDYFSAHTPIIGNLQEKNCVDEIQKNGLVVFGSTLEGQFRREVQKIGNKKPLQPWARWTQQISEKATGGMRAFVDMNPFFRNGLIKEFISQESEIESEFQNNGRSESAVKIFCGYLQSDIAMLTPELYSMLQQHHSLIYAVP